MKMVHLAIAGISPRALGLAFALLLGCLTALSRPAIAQTFTLLPLPVANSRPYEITTGPDGNLWFTDNPFDDFVAVGRITPAGIVTSPRAG